MNSHEELDPASGGCQQRLANQQQHLWRSSWGLPHARYGRCPRSCRRRRSRRRRRCCRRRGGDLLFQLPQVCPEEQSLMAAHHVPRATATPKVQHNRGRPPLHGSGFLASHQIAPKKGQCPAVSPLVPLPPLPPLQLQPPLQLPSTRQSPRPWPRPRPSPPPPPLAPMGPPMMLEGLSLRPTPPLLPPRALSRPLGCRLQA
mmetsp:Transcript_106076/g.266916  ORF Transcript_106076/g.266916 Transcript_106076/m.266916 type:complete len:201 (-) Transcript_106076:938-1540(-)